MFFKLCTCAHFFCFHPKIAVPCTILILGPVASRCLRRPCCAKCRTRAPSAHARKNFSQKMFFFSFFFRVFCEQLPVPLLRFSGALRASLLGRTPMFFELCTRAHFFCFHPKIAVPCTILILGPVASRCLRRPCWAKCRTRAPSAHARKNFSQKMFFFSFFFRVFCERLPRK